MSSRPLVPSAKEKLDKLKSEAANEIGMHFSYDDKIESASKLNGFIGGPTGGLMTKKMVEDFEKRLAKKK